MWKKAGQHFRFGCPSSDCGCELRNSKNLRRCNYGSVKSSGNCIGNSNSKGTAAAAAVAAVAVVVVVGVVVALAAVVAAATAVTVVRCDAIRWVVTGCACDVLCGDMMMWLECGMLRCDAGSEWEYGYEPPEWHRDLTPLVKSILRVSETLMMLKEDGGISGSYLDWEIESINVHFMLIGSAGGGTH